MSRRIGNPNQIRLQLSLYNARKSVMFQSRGPATAKVRERLSM